MYVSVTRLRIRGRRHLPAFIVMALRSALQAKAADGNVGVALLAEAHRTYWTRTIWTDERAMRRFIIAQPHRQAMRKISDWCDEAAIVHWTQESAQAPPWTVAQQRMQSEGRPTKIAQPAPAHERFQIAPPKIGYFSQLRFK
jgi:heme-degrading monooxygenase HmoA